MKRMSLLRALLFALVLASPVLAAGPVPEAASPPAVPAEAGAPEATEPAAAALPWLTPEPLFTASTCVPCTTHAQCQTLCGGPAGCLRDLALECGSSTTAKFCTCF
jgi:hypothetical protein